MKKKLFLMMLLLVSVFVFVVNAEDTFGCTLGEMSCSGWAEEVKCVDNAHQSSTYKSRGYDYPHWSKPVSCTGSEICSASKGGCYSPQIPEGPEDPLTPDNPNECKLQSVEYCIGNVVTDEKVCIENRWCYKLNGNMGKIITGSTDCDCPSDYKWGPREEYGYSWCFNTAEGICDASVDNDLGTGWRCTNDPCGGGEDPVCGDGKVNQNWEECDDGNKVNGDGCENDCTITQEDYCELVIEKTDSPDPVEPGDDLFYTIRIENVGTADCTGTGVKLWEYYDYDTLFISASPSPISGDDFWNFGVIEPGEVEEVQIHVRVKETAECGDNYIINNVRVWSLENGYQYEEAMTYVKCPDCVDECPHEGFVCKGDELWECGNFDDDICLEERPLEDCTELSDTSKEYYICEAGWSVKKRDVTEGYCEEFIPYEAECDIIEYTEIVDQEDCVDTETEYTEFCENNNVWERIVEEEFFCRESTGRCDSRLNDPEENLIHECISGEDSFCDGDEKVYSEYTETCVEDNDMAYCEYDEEQEREDCGPDICVPHTDMNVYVQEYVVDEETCLENGEAYCGNDETIYDICMTDKILWQYYCDGNDAAYEEYDCDAELSGCVEFEVEECVTCYDTYDHRCKGDWCTLTGEVYREYYCAGGACQYTEYDLVDTDGDYIDDVYCDDCIDVDRDGACDDVDTCPGVYNPTQVDSDNDGLGNACDNDRDDDGFTDNVDCNDWNADINPGVEEIPNNGIDDDCNPLTLDKGAYTPRQLMYVDIVYDETSIQAGNELLVSVAVTNNGVKEIENVKFAVSIPGFQERRTKLVRELDAGETRVKVFALEMPDELRGWEYLKVTVSNDYYKRNIYRELKLPTETTQT